MTRKKRNGLQHDWTMDEVLSVLGEKDDGYRLLAAWYRDEPVFIELMNHYGLGNHEAMSGRMALREFREKMERCEGYDHEQLKEVVTYTFESIDGWLKQTKRDADRYHQTGEGHDAITAWHSIYDRPDFLRLGKEQRILVFDGSKYTEHTVTAENYADTIRQTDGAYCWTYAARAPRPSVPSYHFSRDLARLVSLVSDGLTVIGLANYAKLPNEKIDYIVTVYADSVKTDGLYDSHLFVNYGNGQNSINFGLNAPDLYEQLKKIDLRFLDPKDIKEEG